MTQLEKWAENFAHTYDEADLATRAIVFLAFQHGAQTMREKCAQFVSEQQTKSEGSQVSVSAIFKIGESECKE